MISSGFPLAILVERVSKSLLKTSKGYPDGSSCRFIKDLPRIAHKCPNDFKWPPEEFLWPQLIKWSFGSRGDSWGLTPRALLKDFWRIFEGSLAIVWSISSGMPHNYPMDSKWPPYVFVCDPQLPNSFATMSNGILSLTDSCSLPKSPSKIP